MVEVEGWFIYGYVPLLPVLPRVILMESVFSSKTSPIPHAYIRLPDPERQFVTGVGYDVDVELELVRPRRADSEESGALLFHLEIAFWCARRSCKSGLCPAVQERISRSLS